MTAKHAHDSPGEALSPSSYDALVIGAGMSGIYQLYRLRELGLNVRVLEAGTGVGGTWYWNRYPGARFDSESYSYGYSFSKEVLQEWSWSEHFAPQPETERYVNFVADKFGLKTHIEFKTRIAAAHWQEDSRTWLLTSEAGRRWQAPFLITAVGPLSAPTLPRIKGIDSFKGEAYHTGLWPKHAVTFERKRVAVIGTGATGVQTITEVAKTARHLTVFQRRPNWCKPLHNARITPEEQAGIKASYPAIFKQCQESFACFLHDIYPHDTFDLTPAEREAFLEEQYQKRGFALWMGNFRDLMTNREANAVVSDFVARKIRARVKDPRVAELLIPRDHGFGTRRVPMESGYFEVFNQPNVELVSIIDTPIEEITPTGIRTAARAFGFDMIIYATGFDAITGSLDRIDIRGAGGHKLKDRWKGGPQTFLGIHVDGFPNMLMVMGPHTALGNIPRSIEYNVDWVTRLIEHMRQRGLACADATPEAISAWTDYVLEKAQGLLSNEVDSWMTGINQNVEGKNVRTVARYSGSAPAYRRRAEAVAANGYRELRLEQ
jgi:cation diffusion facilitator CzcD-associated flavoprotein CzcO